MAALKYLVEFPSQKGVDWVVGLCKGVLGTFFSYKVKYWGLLSVDSWLLDCVCHSLLFIPVRTPVPYMGKKIKPYGTSYIFKLQAYLLI